MQIELVFIERFLSLVFLIGLSVLKVPRGGGMIAFQVKS
jgi:hypothetical protein